VALEGVFAAVAPRTTFSLLTKSWTLGLKNVEEIEPRDWYVTAIRTAGIGMLAAGIAGLALTGEGEPEREEVEPIDIAPSDE
jgi:hypothetical protein